MFKLFIPLTKVDKANRLVYGVMTAEVPDKSGEILDYASAKPAIQKWSDGMSAASGGANLGNVRLMHGKVAVGKVTELNFDDETKTVTVCTKCVDDAAWKLIDEQVLTGFSIGGGYAKRWIDPNNRALKRFTPDMSEVSYVDNPCLPGATFEMVKADGTSETVEWSPRFEPGNDEVKALAEDMAKLAGKPDRRNDFLAKARADLIHDHAEGVADELEKVAADAVAAAVDPAAALEAAVADAGAALDKGAKPYGDVEYADPKDGKYPIDTPAHIRAAWSYINMPKNAEKVADAGGVKGKIVAAWKKKIDPDGPPSAEKVQFVVDLFKSGAAIPLITAIHKVALEKGFYTVQRTASLLNQMSDIASGVIWEERFEEDESSALPQGIIDLMASTKSYLISMINEETAEFFAECETNGGDSIALLAPSDVDGMALSAKATDLRKLHVDDGTMEKVGKRTSSSDMKHVQSMHDHTQALGAKCDSGNCDKVVADGDLAKAAEQGEALEKANRAIRAALPQIQALTKTVREDREAMAKASADSAAAIAALQGEVDLLKNGPGLAKGRLYAVSKENDGSGNALPIDGQAAFDWGSATASDRRERALLNMAKRGQLGPRALPAPGGGY